MKRLLGVVTLLLMGLLSGASVRAQVSVTFAAGGLVSYGAGQWATQGAINGLTFYPGDSLEMLMDVRMLLPEGNLTSDYKMGAILLIKQVFTANGQQLPYNPSEPWSPYIENDLPLMGVQIAARALQSSTTEAVQIIDEQTLGFQLGYRTNIPQDLDAGIYVVLLAGFASVGDSEDFGWYANRIFSTTGTGGADFDTRLPLLIRIGAVEAPHAEWTLGGRALPTDSAARLFNARPLVIAPGTLTLTPSLVSLPYVTPFPNGSLSGKVEFLGSAAYPTGDPEPQLVLDLPPAPFTGITERDGYYDLTVDDPTYTVAFTRYGTYRVTLTGELVDIFGSRYAGGGTYTLVVAEPISLMPAILPGQAWQQNSVDAPGFTTSSLPDNAKTSISIITTALDGTLNTVTPPTRLAHNIVTTQAPVALPDGGMYRVQYRASFTDADGRLWLGEQTAHGIISQSAGALMAHGRRGLDGYNRQPQAWFDTRNYPFDAAFDGLTVNFPYVSGDMAFIPNSENAGIRAVLTVQDNQGDYARMLQQRFSTFANPEGDLAELIRRDSLPLLYPSSFALMTIVDAQGVALTLAQANADGGFNPVLPTQGYAAGDALFLVGGIVLKTPQTLTLPYTAAVRITEDDYAQVVSGDTVAPAIWVTRGAAGEVVPINTAITAQVPLSAPASHFLWRIENPDGVVTRVTSLTDVPQFYDALGVWHLQLEDVMHGVTVFNHAIYVVPNITQPLGIAQTIYDVDTRQPISIRVDVPEGWTDTVASISIRSPQTLLEERTVDVASQQFTLNVNRGSYTRDLPTVADDVLTVTLALTGTDTDGAFRIRTRTFTIEADRVVSFG